MATVYRKTYTKPLPSGATILTRKGHRFAQWRDHDGKKRTAKMTTGKDGSARLIIEAATYTAKYRDGSGVVCEVATGCCSKHAARQVLADLVKRAEHVRSGITTAGQDAIIDHQCTALSEHLDAYLDHMTSTGTTADHRKTTRAYLNRLSAACTFSKLSDLAGRQKTTGRQRTTGTTWTTEGGRLLPRGRPRACARIYLTMKEPPAILIAG